MASFSMTIGDYRAFQVAVTMGGAPYNLSTVSSLTFTLLSLKGVVLATFGIGTGVTLTNASGGIAVLAITAAMFNGIAPQQCSYRWGCVDALGNATQALDTGSFQLTS